MRRPAPEFESMPRWLKCQSFMQPSSALYWHIGETTMRLASSTGPRLKGENRLDIDFPEVGIGRPPVLVARAGVRISFPDSHRFAAPALCFFRARAGPYPCFPRPSNT